MLRRFGFGERLWSWISVYVLCRNLYLLAIGSQTEEINIQRGLKQVDSLSPFLFLLVVDGLSGDVSSAE